MLTLRLPDPERRHGGVALDAGVGGGPCRYRAGGWERRVDVTDLWRLEYAFVVGRGQRILDPSAAETIQTDFGPRSVWLRADYEVPDWLGAPAVRGRLTTMQLPSALAHPLTVRVWQPNGMGRRPAPLVWCHDGSGYLRHAQIRQWAGAQISAGRLPPMRVVLADAPRRMQWYSGSELYVRSFRMGLEALRSRYSVVGHVAVIGASLGGLTSMLLAMREPRIGVVLSQSGSFFDARIDDSDRGFRWFDRITKRVERVRVTRPRDDLLIGMTCGAREGNAVLNRRLASDLTANGWHVDFRLHPDLHNWTSWRDSLEPILSNALQNSWSAVG